MRNAKEKNNCLSSIIVIKRGGRMNWPIVIKTDMENCPYRYRNMTKDDLFSKAPVDCWLTGFKRCTRKNCPCKVNDKCSHPSEKQEMWKKFIKEKKSWAK